MTTPPSFRIRPLTADLDRTTFCSGSAPLDRYLREQITQDVRRRVAACFVAMTTEATPRLAGYYTLASASLLLADLPATTARKLPRYPSVPAVRMGGWRSIRRSRGKDWAAPWSPMRWTGRSARRLPPMR